VIQGYRSSKEVVQGYNRITVILGLCRGSLVQACYRDTRVVHCY